MSTTRVLHFCMNGQLFYRFSCTFWHRFSMIAFLLFCLSKGQAQVDTLKVWYDLERKSLKEIYYHSDRSSKESTNEIDGTKLYSFYSLQALDKYDRFKKFDEKGRIVAIAEVDSIPKNDDRARFSQMSWLIDGEWEKDSSQLNPIQEQWRFYGYGQGKKSLIRERLIEYNYNNDDLIKGVASELEHLETSRDSIYGKNIDYAMNCDVIFTHYQTIELADNQKLNTPRILYQTFIRGGENVGTTKEYFPYSGELAREVVFKNGKVKKIVCYSYYGILIERIDGKSYQENFYADYSKSVFKRNKVFFYDLEGNRIGKSKKNLSGKVPICQCDNAYFDRAYFYIENIKYIKPFLDRYGAKNY